MPPPHDNENNSLSHILYKDARPMGSFATLSSSSSFNLSKFHGSATLFLLRILEVSVLAQFPFPEIFYFIIHVFY